MHSAPENARKPMPWPTPPRRRARLRSGGPFLLLILLLALSGCASQRLERPREGVTQRGVASWYGPNFHGKPTASGEIYDMHGLSAAHRDLPLGTKIEVTNLDNQRQITVRVNDRGPFVHGRILDLSLGAAKKLDMEEAGLARVEIRVLTLGSGRPGDLNAKAFTVQVGVFRDLENAKRLLNRVRRVHAEAKIVREGDLHRVRVGDFPRREEAEALQDKLRRQGMKDSIIVPIPRS